MASGLPRKRPLCVLAPMVRTGELPTRLLSLKYGASLVWGPETVDKAIIGSTRTPNPAIFCTDFTKPSNNKPGEAPRVVFRTHSILETAARKLIFQLGTADPALAVDAARVVARDVAGIGVNAGCPKHFSIHSGMGAALLQTPDLLCEILTNLVKAVGPGTEFNVPISVKIRLLEPHEKTFGLVERLVKTGIEHLTVHMRTTPMRPREPAIRDPEIIRGIVRICREAGVGILVNGDIDHRAASDYLSEQYDLDGCMIARAAEANPSCFIGGQKEVKPWLDVAREFLATAMDVDNHFSNTKFILNHIVDSKNPKYKQITSAKTYKDMCEILEVPELSSDAEVVKEPKKEPEAVEKAKSGGYESAVVAGGVAPGKKTKKQKLRGVGGQVSHKKQQQGMTQAVPMLS
ncbi:FMN-linked oxidoreductase [Terfezia boudieri ATCC MYA-4762]|uniref:FMN-linked oxidoreductase n=1 Tax=Terfezia boudieri ATCC MYA-4762 TaxID=1051890 RepID=A0A3N4M0N0_9PEZI|nr:FMN-linked oxidoreductase [Terfezia boudieri ATCC MYA-4762]